MINNDKSLVLSSGNKIEKVGNLISITNKLTNVEFVREKWWDVLDRGWKECINHSYLVSRNVFPSLNEIKNLDFFDIMIDLTKNGGGICGWGEKFDFEPNNLNLIQNLTKISHIKIWINYYTSFEGNELIEAKNYKFDLGLLKKFPKLKKLMISDRGLEYGPNFKNFEVVYSLKNLKELDLEDFCDSNFKELENLKNLEVLSINNNKKYTYNLFHLYKNLSLKKLVLKFGDSIIDNDTIINIGKCINLYELDIFLNNESINFEPLTNIKKLKIQYRCFNTNDVIQLSKIRNLEELNICGGIIDENIDNNIDYGNFILLEKLRKFEFIFFEDNLKNLNLSDFVFNNLNAFDLYTQEESILLDKDEIENFLYLNQNCYLNIYGQYNRPIITYIYTDGKICTYNY